MVIDIHCHVIPEIDDGAKDKKTALEMCRIAQADGTRGIIATPHYIHGVVKNTKDLVHEKVIEMNSYLQDEKIDIEIYPGSEIFICQELPKLVREGQVCTLNNTNYVLLELPLNGIPKYTIDVIYQLKLDGYTPIIAHPERNLEISQNPNLLYDFITRGALSQVNTTSLKGVFGRDALNTAIELLKRNMVHLLASDAHSTGGRSPQLSHSIDLVERKLGPGSLLHLMQNGLQVLNNQRLEIKEPILVREKRRLKFW